MAIGAIWDEIWGNIWDTGIWSQSAPSDTVPDDDAFTSQTNIVPSASVDSNVLTLTGMSATATASIDGGSMSVDSDTFSATSRTVTANGTIQARQTASASELTQTTVNITISGIVFEFAVTTGMLAATLSSATVTPSARSAMIQVSTDKQDGTWYWVVTESATQPSIAQIKAGQDHLGASAVAAGSPSVSVAGVQADNANGLTPETTYYAHSVQATTADSNRLSSASFDTLAAGLGNKTPFGAPSDFNQFGF